TDNQAQPPRQFQVEASLAYITDHSYWWVQDDFDVNEEALQRSAERFENQTYPTNRAFFGSEWSPGIDGDVRVHIFMGDVPGVAGYFSASNEYSKLAEPYSNEREMFFINLRAISPGNDYFDGVLSHEFQHMIHWYEDRNEDTWVNEGMSELATFLNGYGPSSFIGAFTATPDTQLTGWADSPGAATANYGGSFMFMAYFLQRYGEEMTQAVVAHPENGIAGFNAVLAEHGYPEQFDDIFADFLVANYLQNPDAGEGLWGYRDFSPGASAIRKLYRVYPQTEQNTVYQYGGDYVELTGFGDVTIEFTGSTQVPVVDNEAHSGRYQWYSHRGDDTNTRLTRAFDLSGVEQATLHYWTWYDIEPDWDYAYVEISTDGGTSWTILQTPHSATTNPSGNAYGPGYTGRSDGWLEEELDISAYAGHEVLIRFEYVTDDAVNRPGWTVDDIRIPEINFFDDAEAGDNDWQAEGFVRIDNILPQRFAVRVIEIGEEITVRTLPLDETNYGTLTVEGLGDRVERAVLITSGLAPVTSEPAGYEYTLTATGQ
ncbi:MAG: immune inhibitor A, partial [Anaerolineae bacterium]|nr:immune inhibitor A [Anaerolineae bacterium]